MSIGADWLQLAAAGAVAFAIFCYVVLDGTDLGVGMLFLCNRDQAHRRILSRSLLPIWDGNETWLVLGGGGLLAMFPKIYSLFLTAAYLPIFLMLLALIARAVALEYRARSSVPIQRWLDPLFIGGSLLAALSQGILLGMLLQGIPHRDGLYRGNGWEWLQPFPLATGVALALCYALMGACWIIWRTGGELRERGKRQAWALAGATLVAGASVAVWLGWASSIYQDGLPAGWLLGALGAALAMTLVLFCTVMGGRQDFLPLFVVLLAVALAYLALLLTLYPLAIPPDITLYEASASPRSLGFVLAGFALLIPITLAYCTFGFRVFAGKLGDPEDAGDVR